MGGGVLLGKDFKNVKKLGKVDLIFFFKIILIGVYFDKYVLD